MAHRTVMAMIALLVLGAQASLAAEPRRSGYDDASAETRAMQDDDAANPAFLWVAQGQTLWTTPTGSSARSCDTCHGDARVSMRGVAARYPKFDPSLGRPITLEGRIQQCRTDRQAGSPLPSEGDAMLALTAYVGLQSRGLPVAVADDAPARPFLEAGQRLFETRMGQLNLSCAQCHDRLAGQRLAGSTIPQGHPNGYPLYRLEWQGMGSLYRRLRNCLTGVRAQPFPPDSPEVVALSLYLAWRANGLKVETPAVRP
jgi:sulfur-oxidizing protein SoxA